MPKPQRFVQRSSTLLLVLAALACGACEHAIEECKDAAGAHAICGLRNPEDLVALPDGRAILISEYSSMETNEPGALVRYDLASEKITPVFPQGGPGVEPVISEGPDWGDARCPGPPDKHFSPHGIDLKRRADGRLSLFAVNHGREAIEIFEIDPESYGAMWRGCVPMPEGTNLNDVTALPDGGFATTHAFPHSQGLAQLWYLAKATLGGNTGWVYVWHPGGALKKLANSDSPFPNGITASPDGSTLFVDIYMANEVRRYATASGKLTGSAHIEHADNVSWSDHDTLLVASHIAGLSRMNSCGRIEKGACSARFQIVELDPKTLATRVVVDREGAPMGAATVAIPLGDYLYLGSYKSDRMLRIPRKR